MDEPNRARLVLTEAVRVTMNIGDVTKLGEVWPVGHAMFVLAAVDALEEDSPRAALRTGAAEAVMQRLGLSLPPPLQRRVDQTVAQLISDLGEEAFQSLREECRSDPTAVIAAVLAADPTGAVNTSAELDLTLARLSARERQVLRRIAQGQSDREIAEALFISRKTVSNHVTNILRKLDVDNRAAAAVKSLSDRLI